MAVCFGDSPMPIGAWTGRRWLLARLDHSHTVKFRN
jgi:hypothetical protein